MRAYTEAQGRTLQSPPPSRQAAERKQSKQVAEAKRCFLCHCTDAAPSSYATHGARLLTLRTVPAVPRGPTPVEMDQRSEEAWRRSSRREPQTRARLRQTLASYGSVYRKSRRFARFKKVAGPSPKFSRNSTLRHRLFDTVDCLAGQPRRTRQVREESLIYRRRARDSEIKDRRLFCARGA